MPVILNKSYMQQIQRELLEACYEEHNELEAARHRLWLAVLQRKN